MERHIQIEDQIYDKICAEALQIKEQIIEHRRYLHRNPEIGFDTANTEAYVKKYLEAAGVALLPAKMGVMARIPGKDSSRMVALRADMDALCLQEKNEVAYRSTCPNKMHACGHDGHTAMLMAAAGILQENRDSLPVDVLLMFQPAEEGPNLGGARVMLGDLEEKGMLSSIEAIFAQHVTNEYDIGKVIIRYGSSMSSTDEFDIEIVGKGGHAGMPHMAVDAVSLAAKFVIEMESFMSRRMDPCDPAVFSVGILNAGSARNIISETAVLSGTIRCQSEYNRDFILKSAEEILRGICGYSGATCQFQVRRGIPVLINDEHMTRYAQEVAEKVVGKGSIVNQETPQMGAEDFAYLAQRIPASFLFLGTRNESKGLVNMAHHPRFDFDEDALVTGTKLLCCIVMGWS